MRNANHVLVVRNISSYSALPNTFLLITTDFPQLRPCSWIGSLVMFELKRVDDMSHQRPWSIFAEIWVEWGGVFRRSTV